METFLFHLSAVAVLPAWFLLIFQPTRPFTQKHATSIVMIIVPSLCYAGLLIPHLDAALFSVFWPPGPAAFHKIFSQPWGTSMYWAYAGAFDLFVGQWIFCDGQKNKIPHKFIAPILALTIFFGPLGFLSYVTVKKITGEP